MKRIILWRKSYEYHRSTKRASPQLVQTPFSIFTRLGAILIKYGAEKDLLSKNLMSAGHAFMVHALQNRGRPIKEYLQGTLEKIAEIQKVLKNPYGPSTFKNPWLIEGAVTWDKSTLDEYQIYVSRFSNKVIKAIPHKFAVEVLEWIAEFPMQTQKPILQIQSSGQAAIQPLALSKEVQEYQSYMHYEHSIVQAKQLQESLALIQQLEEINGVLEEENIQGFQRFEQILARQEESQLQQTQELTRGISALGAELQTTSALYKEANAAAEATLRQVQEELDKARIVMNRQQVQINGLCLQAYYLKDELNKLKNENDSNCFLM